MTVILDDSDDDLETFEWNDDATGGNYFRARDTARTCIDLRRLLARYSRSPLVEADAGFKTRCFLRSRVSGFSGTCYEQDASEGHPGEHLSITLAEDGSHWRWRCFSCGRGQTRDGSRPGDVVDLVTHAEGFPINDNRSGSLRALRFALKLGGLDHVLDGLAAPRAGQEPVDASLLVDDVPRSAAQARVHVPLDRALALNKRAREHWQAALQAHDGANAREYLATRGVTPQQIERYAIGWARGSWSNLAALVEPRDVAVAEALGLARTSKTTGKPIDAQRNRVVFPYCYPARDDDARPLGVYGFAGRNLIGVDPSTGEDIQDFAHHDNRPPPKWYNSKVVPGVWEKGAELVGVWQSLRRARALGRAGLCEGAFDMLAFDRIDVPAPALVSAEPSIGHALLIRSTLRVSEVTYACDGDARGRRAAVKFAAAFIAAGFDPAALTVIDSDDGRDPATTPAEMLRERWDAPIPAIDFIASLLTRPELDKRGEPTGEMTLTRDGLRPLLAAAPELAERFGLAGTHNRATVTTADALVLRSLLAQPDLAQHLARVDAEALLAECPIWAGACDLQFGESTNASALPIDARRAWLLLDHARRQLAAAKHDQHRPTALPDQLAWLQKSAELHRAERLVREQLIEINALF